MTAGTSEKDVLCALCGTSVVGARFDVCPQCEVPAHVQCWSASGRCPAFGCGAIDPIDPAIALYRRPRQQTLPAPAAREAAAGRVSGPGDPKARIQALEARLGQISRMKLRKVFPFGIAGLGFLLAFRLPYTLDPASAIVVATAGGAFLAILAMMSTGQQLWHGYIRIVKGINTQLDVLRAQQIK